MPEPFFDSPLCGFRYNALSLLTSIVKMSRIRNSRLTMHCMRTRNSNADATVNGESAIYWYVMDFSFENHTSLAVTLCVTVHVFHCHN